MATILHISDLHRDADGHLTTSALIESLRRDREHYLQEGLSTPDLVIVSGDLALGVKGASDAMRADLARQYLEAEDFLQQLADLMLSGDRERIIIVPGNHDVSHEHVMRASVPEDIPVDPERRKIVAQRLANEGSPYRWVANEFSLRLINDFEIYKQRMSPFADFYRRFYQGKREFSLVDENQYQLHDFPDLNLVVVGLSSCCDNDIFNRSGRIHPACIAEATRIVANSIARGSIAIAVWHHNLSGGPKDSDYVDPEFLQSLIDGGFSLGLHGHQHRPQFIEHRFTADNKRGMAVISAGTLCGGPRTLPPGRRRAYNLISLDHDEPGGYLHVREMKNSGFGMPVWGAAHVIEFNGSSIKFELKIQRKPLSAGKVASDALDLLRKGDAAGAFSLANSCATDPLARRVAVQALSQTDDWDKIIKFCTPPQSNVEIIALINALDEIGEKTTLSRLIQSDVVSKSQDLAVRQLVSQLRF